MIDFSAIKAITIPEGVVKKIVSAGVALWEAIKYVNQVLVSVGTDGKVYNSVGYKDHCRIRSSGAEQAQDYLSCTGFIPCKAGDVIRFRFASGATLWTDYTGALTSMNFSDASKTNLGQFTSQPAHYGIFSGTGEVDKAKKVNGSWEYTVIDNADIRFVRFTVPYSDGGNRGGGNLIVTVNEEIT